MNGRYIDGYAKSDIDLRLLRLEAAKVEVLPVTRQDRDAEAIRQRILAVGREMFSTRPYSDITDRLICKRAGISQGALQHHFGSKLGLFMSVFEGLEHGVFVRMISAIGRHQEPWERVRAGIAALLDAHAQPAYQSVVLREGPAAIGWERWLELDGTYYSELVQWIFDMIPSTRLDDRPIGMLVAVMRGALGELAYEIAQSVDQELARRQALVVIDSVLGAFCQLEADNAPPEPIKVGIRQLKSCISMYIDRVAAGAIIDVTRYGRVVARLQQSTG